MGRINIQLDNKLHTKLKIVCTIKNTTLEKYINQALEEKNGR